VAGATSSRASRLRRLRSPVDNKDGRFTAENASGAYYPNVKLGRRCRVSVRQTDTTGALNVFGNFLSANAASMETSIVDWLPGGSVPPTLAQSNTHVQDGTQGASG
jgi:hypothetical protein